MLILQIKIFYNTKNLFFIKALKKPWCIKLIPSFFSLGITPLKDSFTGYERQIKYTTHP